jgi:selenoprotein W-related protein
MAEAVMTTFRTPMGVPHPIEAVTLVPSDGGRFEVSVDGDLIYSKLATGTHTTNEHVIELIKARIPLDG